MKNIQRTDKDTQRQWVHKTFSTYKPEYHITICWKDKPSSDITASGHLKVTKNLMNRLLTGVSTCSDIPDFPERPGSVWFHEVSVMLGSISETYSTSTIGLSRRDTSSTQRKDSGTTKR